MDIYFRLIGLVGRPKSRAAAISAWTKSLYVIIVLSLYMDRC